MNDVLTPTERRSRMSDDSLQIEFEYADVWHVNDYEDRVRMKCETKFNDIMMIERMVSGVQTKLFNAVCTCRWM